MQVVNWTSYTRYGNPAGEVNNLPSKTVPGQTLSLKELLDRYVRTGVLEQTFTPEYSDDDDLPDVTRMNEMDRLDAAKQLRDFVIEGATKHNDEVAKYNDRVSKKEAERLDKQKQADTAAAAVQHDAAKQ